MRRAARARPPRWRRRDRTCPRGCVGSSRRTRRGPHRVDPAAGGVPRWTWTWTGAPWTCGAGPAARRPPPSARPGGLGADVHEDEPLGQEQDRKPTTSKRRRRRAATLDSLETWKKAAPSITPAENESSTSSGAPPRAGGAAGRRRRRGSPRCRARGLQLVHVSSSPSARIRRASVPRSIPSAAAAATRTPFARASAPAMSGFSTSRMTAS